MLINEYKKAGYDALVDYFDKGAMAKLPLILFNASSDVVKTGEKAVNLNDFKESIDLLAQTKGHPSRFDASLIKWRGAYKQQYDAVFGKNAS